MKYTILTNNPLVNEEFQDTHCVSFFDVKSKSILGKAGELVSEGDRLLNHPLYGSVKPNETPYRTLLLMKRDSSSFAAASSEESAVLIDKALRTFEKFSDKKEITDQKLLRDYQAVDLSLAASAIAAADE